MKKLISTGLLSLTLFFGLGIATIPYTAQAQGITLQQLIQLFIVLGIIPANKVALAEAAVGIMPSPVSTPTTIASPTYSATSSPSTPTTPVTASTCTVEGQGGYNACVSPCGVQNNMCVLPPPTQVTTPTCTTVVQNNVCLTQTQLAQEGITITYSPSSQTPPSYPIHPIYVPPTISMLHADATLKSLTINGTLITGFNPNTTTYNVTAPAGIPQAPTLAAIPNDPTATDAITQAANSFGSATVVVTAQNGTTRNYYTINFKPADVGQCNFAGNIFPCASDSSITVSPTSLPNATVGANYSQPISISDTDTTSQSFRWNIISGVFPPGLGLAFSPTQAIECTGTYCFFTTPPSGVSVPSNTPGVFFGTPMTAGTYSFTFQAIDGLNYIAMPTFTITIASSTVAQ